MELIKENKEKLRRVYKGANFYRKQWDFANQEWLDDHIDIMEEVRPGYIINHGVEGGRMFIDTKIIEGTVANTLPHTPEFIKSISLAKKFKNVEILWASVREPYNYLQATQLGCHVITVPPSIIEKIEKFGKTFNKLTVETVKAFLIDSKKSKFKI